ncbi:MAG: EF-P lysine aminoacylase GenX [Lentisphaeria bacterium]|nr:EF-P lysine aminoacylase GenX [Lentisphaeria bacterium]
MELHFDRDCVAAKKDIARLRELQDNLRSRNKMMAALRRWFDKEDFLEVESPVRIPAPALEDYIDAVESGPSKWLRTSPELHLKRLLAAGYPRIFEIGPCFRFGEAGDHHREEFTMLEWYRLNGDWRVLMDDVQGMVRAAVEATHPGESRLPFRGHVIDYASPWQSMTVEEAFAKYADVSLRQAIDSGDFEMVLCTQVEPHLGLETPLFLTEYPMECSGLSAELPGKPGFVARWELYVVGLEIGNACTELANPQEQERRFQCTAELRARENRPVYPMDQPFMNAIWNGFPLCAGTAIGLDRLTMVLTNAEDIAQVRAF